MYLYFTGDTREPAGNLTKTVFVLIVQKDEMKDRQLPTTIASSERVSFARGARNALIESCRHTAKLSENVKNAMKTLLCYW